MQLLVLEFTSIGNLGLDPFPVPDLDSPADGLGLFMTKLLLVADDEGSDR